MNFLTVDKLQLKLKLQLKNCFAWMHFWNKKQLRKKETLIHTFTFPEETLNEFSFSLTLKAVPLPPYNNHFIKINLHLKIIYIIFSSIPRLLHCNKNNNKKKIKMRLLYSTRTDHLYDIKINSKGADMHF